MAISCQSGLLEELLMSTLSSQSDMIVSSVGAASNWDAASPAMKADLMIVQYDSSTVNALQQVSRETPATKILIVDANPEDLDVLQCIRMKVVGFALKDATIADLVSAVRSIVSDAHVVPEPVIAKLYSQLSQTPIGRRRDGSPAFPGLTLRERQVVELVADGLRNKEIADRLGISVYTAKTHVHHILEKLQVHRRIDLLEYFQTSRDKSGQETIAVQSKWTSGIHPGNPSRRPGASHSSAARGAGN